jgi:hypothetical protein
LRFATADIQIQAGKWGSKSYGAAYKAGYAAGVLREQKKELHAQQMMQVGAHDMTSLIPLRDCFCFYTDPKCLVFALAHAAVPG